MSAPEPEPSHDTHIYPNAGHGFFNRDPHFTLTLGETDMFLTSIGWFKGEPTLRVPETEAAGK